MNMFTKTSTLIWSSVLALTVVFASCGSEEKAPVKKAETISVEVSEARQLTLPNNQSFAGSVERANRSNVSTKVMGELQQLRYGIGDYVKKGAVIVRLNDEQMQAQLNQVQANVNQTKAAYANVKTNYERFMRLKEEGSATQKELDDITMAYESAKAQVDAAENKLREVKHLLTYTTIRAPFSGYVVHEFLSEGDMTSPGRPIIAIEEAGVMKLTVTVPENKVNSVNKGDSLLISVPAAGYETTAQVMNVNSSGNIGSRQFTVELSIPQDAADAGVKSGMFGRMFTQEGGKKSTVVPASSLIKRGQLTGVFTVTDNNRLVLRWIRTGQQADDMVEALSGITSGEMLVTKASGRLVEGMNVEIK